MEEDTRKNLFKKLNLTLLEKKKHLILFQTFPLKRQINQAVRDGNIQEVKRLSQEYLFYIKELYDNEKHHDAIFNQVLYEYICGVVETSYIATEGGLNSVIAEDIRDEFMVKVLSCNGLYKIVALHKEMTMEFATLVKLSKMSYPLSREIRVMLQYIEQHLTENITLNDVACEAGLSYYYASALFKNQMGITIKEFIQKEKINLAKKYLSVNGMTIHEVSQKLHFCSQSYFTKVFKENVGMTPKEYLSCHKEGTI